MGAANPKQDAVKLRGISKEIRAFTEIVKAMLDCYPTLPQIRWRDVELASSNLQFHIETAAFALSFEVPGAPVPDLLVRACALLLEADLMLYLESTRDYFEVSPGLAELRAGVNLPRCRECQGLGWVNQRPHERVCDGCHGSGFEVVS